MLADLPREELHSNGFRGPLRPEEARDALEVDIDSDDRERFQAVRDFTHGDVDALHTAMRARESEVGSVPFADSEGALQTLSASKANWAGRLPRHWNVLPDAPLAGPRLRGRMESRAIHAGAPFAPALSPVEGRQAQVVRVAGCGGSAGAGGRALGVDSAARLFEKGSCVACSPLSHVHAPSAYVCAALWTRVRT